MKKVIVFSLLALVLIGCVLAAGCTSISTSGQSNATMLNIPNDTINSNNNGVYIPKDASFASGTMVDSSESSSDESASDEPQVQTGLAQDPKYVPMVEITVLYLAYGPNQRGFYPQSFTYDVDFGSTISFQKNQMSPIYYFTYYQNGELKKRSLIYSDYLIPTGCFYAYNPSDYSGPDFLYTKVTDSNGKTVRYDYSGFGYKNSDELPTPLAHANEELRINGHQKYFVLY